LGIWVTTSKHQQLHSTHQELNLTTSTQNRTLQRQQQLKHTFRSKIEAYNNILFSVSFFPPHFSRLILPSLTVITFLNAFYGVSTYHLI